MLLALVSTFTGIVTMREKCRLKTKKEAAYSDLSSVAFFSLLMEKAHFLT